MFPGDEVPTMRNLVLFTVATLLIAGMGSKIADRFAVAPIVAPDAQAAVSTRGETVVIAGDRSGHFSVNATIAGRSLPFLIDTGASLVVLTQRDAERIGLAPAPSHYKLKIATANGMVMAAQVRLAAVTVGALTVHDVTAVVMPEGALNQNLLGMTFLSRLKRFEFRTGQLVLEQ
jgi:aspartyl protease family protein